MDARSGPEPRRWEDRDLDSVMDSSAPQEELGLHTSPEGDPGAIDPVRAGPIPALGSDTLSCSRCDRWVFRGTVGPTSRPGTLSAD